MLLRNKEICKVCRNVNNPVMFRGLPLQLAKISLIVTVIIAGLGLQLTSMIQGVKSYGVIVITILGIIFSIRFIRNFYKKYGINGYELQKRDKSLIDTIQADKSVEQILKSKVK